MTSSDAGKAYIVGAGPGRADLITVQGLRLLRQADVVIYDRLIARELLAEARADAELIFAGKRPDHQAMTQDEINRLLVERVRAGAQVVRLKGGDPFVFGRGSEEALALRLAGLPYTIVPGISSALAVPLFAGVPVTHRGIAASFAVVTGHACAENSGIDWAALARIPTLIVLMGVRTVADWTESLLKAGRAPDTPAVIICAGTTDHQQSVRAKLAELPSAIAGRELSTPAVIVIGDTAAFHELLDWYIPDGRATGFIEEPVYESFANFVDQS